MMAISLLNLLFVTACLTVLLYLVLMKWPRKKPILLRAPWNRIYKFTKNINVLQAILVVGVLGFLSIVLLDNIFLNFSVSAFDELQLLILFATGLVIVWYTIETYSLRKESEKQTYLAIKPHMAISNTNDSINLHNKGEGVAIGVRVEFWKQSKRIADNYYGDVKDEIITKSFRSYGDSEKLTPVDITKIKVFCTDSANNSYAFSYDQDYQFDLHEIGFMTPNECRHDYKLSKIEMPIQFREKSKTFATHFLIAESISHFHGSATVHTKISKKDNKQK